MLRPRRSRGEKKRRKRMEKKRQKSNGKCKRRKTNDEGNNEGTCMEKQSKVVCIECEVCLNWYIVLTDADCFSNVI